MELFFFCLKPYERLKERAGFPSEKCQWVSKNQTRPRVALCGAVAKGNCPEKPSGTRYPSFPAEKHRASPPMKRCSPEKDETQPLPPFRGGRGKLAFGEKEQTRPCGPLCAVLGREQGRTPATPQTRPVGPVKAPCTATWRNNQSRKKPEIWQATTRKHIHKKLRIEGWTYRDQLR